MRTLVSLALALSLATPALAQDEVTLAAVRAHERFLTSAPLRGRGSATPDEAVAAAYVAAQFEEAGLVPVPGTPGFIQTAPVVARRIVGEARFTADGVTIPGAAILGTPGGAADGVVKRVDKPDAAFARGDAVVYTGNIDDIDKVNAKARSLGVSLVIVPESPAARKLLPDGTFRIGPRLAGTPPRRAPLSVVMLPAAAVAALKPGSTVTFDVPFTETTAETTNAIGFLPGRDPAAKVIMVSAHLDHLGIDGKGVIREGANDDASGTVAVIELAKALAAGPRPRRGVLFVAYGAEEAGLLGSRWFADHPPLPLTRIAANVEFEMIGAQDPKLPKGALMVTGYERSDLPTILARHGAHVAPDPYPEQHFFHRSDNYALALKGIVAHTLSGWATVPTYHTAQDTFASVDLDFMTQAIASLVRPLRALADSADEPKWKPGGRPKP